MKLTTSRIDVRPYLASKQQPAVILPLGKGSPWYVVNRPLVPADLEPVLGREVGEHVRIGLFPYRTLHDPAALAAFCCQLGCFLASWMGKIDELHLAVGLPLEEGEEGGAAYYRLWLGIAVRGTERT